MPDEKQIYTLTLCEIVDQNTLTLRQKNTLLIMSSLFGTFNIQTTDELEEACRLYTTFKKYMGEN